MKYIELDVRTALVMHGYDQNNREIEEAVNETEYVTKLISIDRIQSISEQYLLVSSSHGRVMYWEYRGSMQDLKARLDKKALVID